VHAQNWSGYALDLPALQLLAHTGAVQCFSEGLLLSTTLIAV
jgi:hypothetical protein